MTLQELKDLLEEQPEEYADLEVRVFYPDAQEHLGLDRVSRLSKQGRYLFLEGIK
jgi:hypothetical protein